MARLAAGWRGRRARCQGWGVARSAGMCGPGRLAPPLCLAAAIPMASSIECSRSIPPPTHLCFAVLLLQMTGACVAEPAERGGRGVLKEKKRDEHACITPMLRDGGGGAGKSRGTSPGLLGGGRKGKEEMLIPTCTVFPLLLTRTYPSSSYSSPFLIHQNVAGGGGGSGLGCGQGLRGASKGGGAARLGLPGRKRKREGGSEGERRRRRNVFPSCRRAH